MFAFESKCNLLVVSHRIACWRCDGIHPIGSLSELIRIAHKGDYINRIRSFSVVAFAHVHNYPSNGCIRKTNAFNLEMKECRWIDFFLSFLALWIVSRNFGVSFVSLLLTQYQCMGSIEWQSASFAFFTLCTCHSYRKLVDVWFNWNAMEFFFRHCSGHNTIHSTSSIGTWFSRCVSFPFRHRKNGHEQQPEYVVSCSSLLLPETIGVLCVFGAY